MVQNLFAMETYKKAVKAPSLNSCWVLTTHQLLRSHDVATSALLGELVGIVVFPESAGTLSYSAVCPLVAPIHVRGERMGAKITRATYRVGQFALIGP